MDLSNKNVIHVKNNEIEYLQFRKLLEYSDKITHAYSLGTNVNYRTAKVDKNQLKQEEYDRAIENYKKLCSSLKCDYNNLVKTSQRHTDNIKIVEKKINADKPDISEEYYSDTDGLITDKSNIIITTTNADCILLLFYDPVKNVIANVHSGWRGTLQKISVKCIKKMTEEKGCNPKDIICCICPSIRKCHFEVQRDVFELFYNEFSELKEIDEIITKQKDKERWNVDTVLINRVILEKEGVQAENIIDCGICSVCNSNIIHSYRAEGEGYGLSTAMIELKD